MQEKETLDERLPALFEPDTLLPIQYFEAMRKKHLLEGEKRLILSVLEDAVDCYMKCIEASTNKGMRLFREADEWINHEDKKWVFSFDNVCDMLDINAEYMRAGLARWKVRRLEMIAVRKASLAAQAEADAIAPAPVAMASVPTANPIAMKPKVAARPRRVAHARPVRRSSRKLRKARA